MFRVIRMMNSGGPGATGVKKEREERGRDGERGTEIDRKAKTESEKCQIICVH